VQAEMPRKNDYIVNDGKVPYIRPETKWSYHGQVSKWLNGCLSQKAPMNCGK